MIILGVQGAEGDFVEGVNVLLVPVSLFTTTELNAKLQSDDAEDRPIELGTESFSGIAADFFGIDASSETVSQYIEGLIVKGLKSDDTVTGDEALAILDYVLKNETGQLVYSYFLCDDVGEVERLGLAQDILEHIPFDGNSMANEHTGSMPKGFWDWLVSIFVGLLELVIFIFTLPFLLFGLLLTALVYIGITLLGPIFAAFVFLLIKIIIIIFIFIVFALSLLFTLLSFLILAIIISIIALVTEQSIEWGFLFIEFNLWGLSGRYEIRVEWEDNEFLGIPIPKIISEFILAEQLLSQEVYYPGLGAFKSNENVNPSIDPLILDIPQNSRSLDPFIGDCDTNYTFNIAYYGPADSDPIIKLHLIDEDFNDFSFIMSLEPGTENIYSFSINNLDSGIYQHYYEAIIDETSYLFPENSYLYGPYIDSIALLPVDDLSVLNSAVGDSETEFTFTIKYFGPNGYDPSIKLHLHYTDDFGDSVIEDYNMQKLDILDNNYEDGCIYTLTISGLTPLSDYEYNVDANIESSAPIETNHVLYPLSEDDSSSISLCNGPAVSSNNIEAIYEKSINIFYSLLTVTYASLIVFLASRNCKYLAWVGLILIIVAFAFFIWHISSIPLDEGGIEITFLTASISFIILMTLLMAYKSRVKPWGESEILWKTCVVHFLLIVAPRLWDAFSLQLSEELDVETYQKISEAMAISFSIAYWFGIVILSEVVVSALFGKAFGRVPEADPTSKTLFKVFIGTWAVFAIFLFALTIVRITGKW